MGNLGSVRASLRRLGHETSVWETAADVRPVDWVVIPGVGAMGRAGSSLQGRQLWSPLTGLYHAGQPIFGICLGMQIWFGESQEGGRGLDWLKGGVSQLDAPTVPHIGWNQLAVNEHTAPAWLRGYHGDSFYFVHSYAVESLEQDTIAAVTAYHGAEFPSVIVKKPLVGTQFHPELSADAGESLLADILREGR